MSRAAFLAAVGPRLLHITPVENLPSIRRRGLLPAATLAKAAGVDPRALVLRQTRLKLSCGARLTHQLPIVQGRRAAERVLDGYTPESWAAQLDARVFFWTDQLGRAFRASMDRDLPTEAIWLDAAKLYDLAADRLDLAPANSGNFRQGGARMQRGDWLYVPARRATEFPTNRVRRGLVKTADKVKEVSLRGPLTADDLAEVWL